MKVLLVCMGAENLGVGYLSAYLRARGHETRILFDPALFDDKRFLHWPAMAAWCDSRDRLVAEAVGFAPGLIGFSAMSCNLRWARNLAAALRRRLRCPFVWGGIHATLAPEKMVHDPLVDYLIVGEGEEALAELADTLAAGRDPANLANLWLRQGERVISNPLRPLISDLDRLPFPDRQVFRRDTEGRYRLQVMATRGCPYHCSFCSHNHQRTLYPGQQYLRFRSPANVIAEITAACREQPCAAVRFMDDSLTLDRDWLHELLTRYRQEVAVPFECIVHPAHLDGERARLLRAAGCRLVEIGLQSANEDLRRTVLQRTESNAAVAAALAACEQAGLPFTLDYLLAVPGSTAADHARAAEMVADLRRLDRITCYWLTYFPKLDIINHAVAHGLLPAAAREELADGEEIIYLHRGRWDNPATRAADRLYQRYFTLLPLLPCGLRRWLNRNNRVQLLRWLPAALLTPGLLLVTILRGERVQYYYLAYYLRHLLRLAKFRLTGAT